MIWFKNNRFSRKELFCLEVDLEVNQYSSLQFAAEKSVEIKADKSSNTGSHTDIPYTRS